MIELSVLEMDWQVLRKHLINYCTNFESIFIIARTPWTIESGQPKVPSRNSKPTYLGNSEYLSSRETRNIEARPLYSFAMPSESWRHLVTLLSRLMYLQKPNLLELS
jgi:hypothetical protein